MAKAMNILTGEIVELELPVYSAILVPVPGIVEKSRAEDTKTEQGYVPPYQQIEDMRRAGLSLDATRRGRFDSDLYPEGELDLDMAIDPYRDQGADIVDLVKVATLNGARLRKQDELAREEKEKADKARAAQEKLELAKKLVGKTEQEIAQALAGGQ